MKVLSLFSGIGAFEKALDNIGIPYELVAYCDFDKYASKSYAAIHGVPESMNLGDITKVDEKKLPKDIDLITYGFPCQDISLAGKQKGLFNADGTQTRSGLFFDALRIIEETKPKVAIAENVKNLTSKKFAVQFKIVLDSLKAAGYNNYWQVLNAKDYGIPQNRERVFIVSIRKDIDNGSFKFPEAFPLKLRLKDMLEDEVDEKYYLSARLYTGLIQHKEYHQNKGNGFGANFNEPETTDVSATISARYYKDGSECLIQVKEATKTGYAEAHEGDSINFEHPNSKTRRGRVGKQVAQTLTTSPQQVVVTNCFALTTQSKSVRETIENNTFEQGKPLFLDFYNRSTAEIGRTLTEPHHNSHGIYDGLRIRKPTPKECFRLMGFADSDFEKAEAVNSNTQLYKQAGNSIVVPVVECILKSLVDCGVLYD